MFEFSNTDTYKTKRETDNFKIDRKVLLRLYEPLIGAVATSLYLTLDSEINLNNSTRVYLQINRLLKLLHITIEEFNQAIENLKDVSLLSYRANSKRENDYLFKINLPCTANEFLNNTKLFEKFKKEVDEVYLNQVSNYFTTSQIDEDEYVDISEIVKKEISEEEFYISLIDKYPILKDAIDDKLKREVKRVKKLFQASYDKLELALFNSVEYVDNNIKINLINFNDYVENNFKKVQVKSDYEKFLDELDSLNPIQYYEQLFKRTLLPSEERSIINIKEKYMANNGIMNATIYYYYQYGNKEIRNITNYFDKIVSSLISNNCNNALDSMNYFKEYRNSFTSNKQYPNKEAKVYNKPVKATKNYISEDKEKTKSNDEAIDENLYSELLELIGD